MANSAQGLSVVFVSESEKLKARVDFYESCLEQFKKDFPKYLRRHEELEKSSRAMTKVLRNAASSEPNQQLQNTMFLHAQKLDVLDSEREVYKKCEDGITVLLEESKELLVRPLREFLAEYNAAKKRAEKMNDLRESSDTEEALPIHTGMFERHRVRSLKMLLSDILTSEISYHCRAVEELSLVLSSLTEIKEEQATA